MNKLIRQKASELRRYLVFDLTLLLPLHLERECHRTVSAAMEIVLF
jgi:hypothetical protein